MTVGCIRCQPAPDILPLEVKAGGKRNGVRSVLLTNQLGSVGTAYLICSVTTGHIKRHAGGSVWEVPGRRNGISEPPTQPQGWAGKDGVTAARALLTDLGAAVVEKGIINGVV